MVSDGPVLEVRHHWFPTRACGERSFLMNLEFSLNQRPEGDRPSLAEVVWSTGDVGQALSIVPPFMPRETRGKMRRLLQPWPSGRVSDAYSRSGGILNLFTPPWGEADDEVWAGMLSAWQAETFAGDHARQEALRALEQQWNATPHPFFAGLTPSQVMVGGGPREAGLAGEFLTQLARMYEGRPFESEGEALIKTLTLLRGWQSEPRRDGWTVRDIIVAERSALLARRARVLSSSR